EIFDADPVGIGLVIAGLVRDDHAGQQRLRVRGLGDALWALVHSQIAADAMPGAVVVVEPLLPQRAARKAVELCPGGAPRKARQGESDMPLQYAGEAVAHLRRRLTDSDRARYVGGAIEILG